MDHGDCPVVSSKPSDPQQRRPDGRMYFVETAEQLGRLADLRSVALVHSAKAVRRNEMPFRRDTLCGPA